MTPPTTAANDEPVPTPASHDSDRLQPLSLSTRPIPSQTRREVVAILSDAAQLANCLLAQGHYRPLTLTRKALLSGEWHVHRDRALREAVAVLIELPRCRTAAGTKHDRRLADRIHSFLVQNESSRFVMLYGRRGDPAWDLPGLQPLSLLQSLSRSTHH